MVLYNVYTRNLEFKYGAQGVLDALWNSPAMIIINYLTGQTEGLEGSMATIDCCIMISLIGLAGIVGVPGFDTF